MKRILSTTLLLFLLSASLGAAGMKSDFLWDVRDAELSRSGDALTLDVSLLVINDAVASKCAVVLQPYLLSAGRRMDLRPLAFYRLDNRGNRYRVARSGYASGKRDEIAAVCGMAKGVTDYQVSCKGFEVADSIEVMVEVFECRMTDRKVPVEQRKIACFNPSPCPEFYPDFFPVYVPQGRYGSQRSVTVPLRVSFEPGRGDAFDIRCDDNEGDVYEFGEKVKSILSSKHTKVSRISLSYFTGIEGSVSSNQKKASARLQSVYSYLKKQGLFGRRAVATEAVGEDWPGVQSWFASTWWSNERSLSDVVYGASIPKDTRERRMRENAGFWDSYMECEESLERLECYIEYQLLPYSSNQERLTAYYDGGVISEYDFSCLMQDVDLWSAGWYELAFDFAERYPHCREAQLNGFASALSLGQLNEAGKYVRHLSSDSDSRYYKAVWLLYMGDVDAAYQTASALPKDNGVYANTRRQITEIYEWNHSKKPWTANVYRRFEQKR